ncbi:MAG: transposase [Rhabdochlamydiaceae bacterium]
MIASIVSKFQSFRQRLFKLFPYRAGASMDLIDAVAAETNASSVVKLSLSELFRRKYSSLTDVLDSLFRTNLKFAPTIEEQRTQTHKITQLLAEECVPPLQENEFCLFAIDCTADPRIYADKVGDRTIVHAPNHVPGQKPITVGHEYSALVHLPNQAGDRDLHWVVPLSVKRVESNQSGPQVGLVQLEEISNTTAFKDHFCVSVSDAAYSTRGSVINGAKWPNVVQIARMRSNRKVYRMPPSGSKTRRGRPLAYGEEILLGDPPRPDQVEITMTVTRKGYVYRVLLERWNDVVMQGSKDERTHEHPFDLLRVTVTDKKGKPIYRRPLWMMIAGARRRGVASKEAYISYGRRYDIEHFFRFGKQRLGLVNSQTCETRHEENWHWIGLLSYNMLYHTRQLIQPIAHPWEKRKVQVITSVHRPSQVQRDYGRIIRRIGTPAPIPKPRGKSPGRSLGYKSGSRRDHPLIIKSLSNKKADFLADDASAEPKKSHPKSKRNPSSRKRYPRMKRIWAKNRVPRKKKEPLFRIYLN